MASQVYFESDGRGDFYEATQATTAGQSPATHASKWGKIEIPAFMENAVVDLAVAHVQAFEGQADKAAAQRRLAERTLAATFSRHRPRGDYRPLAVARARG